MLDLLKLEILLTAVRGIRAIVPVVKIYSTKHHQELILKNI